MKKKNIFVAIAVSLSLVSCNLDTTPTTALDSSNVYKNTENAERVLRGVWDYITQEGRTYASIGIGSIMLNDDFAGSDMVRTRSYGFSSSYNLTNGYARGEYNGVLWDLLYDPINNCNAILANIDDIQGEEATKARIKGQALATRGYLYMLLATHYSFAIDKDPDAVCVPIRTTPSDGTSAMEGVPAASVKEVFEQSINDLEMALTLIPSNFSHGTAANDQYKIDHAVTLGLLARTHLYARNWEKAYSYAVEALSCNDYLMTEKEYKSGFNDYTNKEWMWSVSPTLDNTYPSYVFWFKDNYCNGYNCVNTDPHFKALFQEGDYRKDLFQWGYTGYGVAALLNAKFRFRDELNELADIDLMRTSEMYLIKAEAAARMGNKESEAQQTLQTLLNARMKEGQTATAVTETGNALVERILIERRKELWGEGFSLTDIIRNQKAVERKAYEATVEIDGEEVNVTGHSILTLPDNTPFVANSKYYLFRIPESEELQNPDLYSKHKRLPIYDMQ